jgi:hypothetical protein
VFLAGLLCQLAQRRRRAGAPFMPAPVMSAPVMSAPGKSIAKQRPMNWPLPMENRPVQFILQQTALRRALAKGNDRSFRNITWYSGITPEASRRLLSVSDTRILRMAGDTAGSHGAGAGSRLPAPEWGASQVSSCGLFETRGFVVLSKHLGRRPYHAHGVPQEDLTAPRRALRRH